MNMKMCLNWKLLVGLGVVAVGIFVVDPPLAARLVPLLLVAACPLSMLLMGVMMAGQNGQQRKSMPDGSNRVLTREEQLAGLQARLQDVTAQQAVLAKQVKQLQVAEEPASPNRMLAEAERVAQVAENRSGR